MNFDPLFAAIVISIPLGIVGAFVIRLYDVMQEKRRARRAKSTDVDHT